MSIVLVGSSSGSITLQEPAVAGTTVLDLPATSGTVVVSGTTPTLNGITFPATQVPSANANTLDDYEEGSWTPTIIGGSTAGTATYNAQRGRYTKIGNRVFVTCVVDYTSGNGTGALIVTGLPFTSINEGDIPFAASETSNIAWSANYSFSPVMGGNTTRVFINQSRVGGSGVGQNTDYDASGYISFSGSYVAA